jgi:hypothetical protein
VTPARLSTVLRFNLLIMSLVISDGGCLTPAEYCSTSDKTTVLVYYAWGTYQTAAGYCTLLLPTNSARWVFQPSVDVTLGLFLLLSVTHCGYYMRPRGLCW